MLHGLSLPGVSASDEAIRGNAVRYGGSGAVIEGRVAMRVLDGRVVTDLPSGMLVSYAVGLGW